MSDPENKIELSEEFLAEVVEDTKINEYDLKGELTHVVNRTQRYLEVYYQQRRKQKKLELHLKRVRGELFQHYKTNFEITLTSSSDILIFVERDQKYRNIKSKLDEIDCIIEFLDFTIKNMKNKPWVLQKMVELEKLNT